MLGRTLMSRGSWRAALASGVLLSFAIVTGPLMAADSINTEADKVLKSMSAYMGGLSAFSVNADVDNEIIDLEGQKIQLSSSGTMDIERPNKLYVRRQGMFADVQLTFDGKTVTIYEKNKNSYFQAEKTGTIDDVIEAMREDIGFDISGADLLYSDPYSGFVSGITSSSYLGTTYVNGVECHHLAFRNAKVDWQLWVKTGDKPLPMKYVITSKWVTGAPEYSIRYRDWNTKPQIDAERFKFTVPKGAKKLETISVDAMGEPLGEGK